MPESTTLRVLFLDEHPASLAQLRAAVAGEAGNWASEFADTAEAALVALERDPFDVLVTALDLHSAEPAVFLRQVRERYPHLARIALSGHSDRAAVVRTLDTIHRHLAKPCEPDALRAAIRQAHEFSQLLAAPGIRAIVNRMSSVPTPGTAVSSVLAELNSPMASAASISALVSEDPALTAQLLRLVNSPVFSLAREITSAFTAVTLLGFDTVGALCLGSRVFSSVDARTLRRTKLAALFPHSVRTANLARAITLEVGGDEEEGGKAFAAGVLHDIGKLVLATNFTREYEEIAEYTAAEERRQEELRRLGASHDRVGGYLLALWGVPMPIVEAVAFHHDPSHHRAYGFSPLSAVHVANAVALASDDKGLPGPWPPPGLDVQHLQQIGLPTEHPLWSGIIREIVSEWQAAG